MVGSKQPTSATEPELRPHELSHNVCAAERPSRAAPTRVPKSPAPPRPPRSRREGRSPSVFHEPGRGDPGGVAVVEASREASGRRRRRAGTIPVSISSRPSSSWRDPIGMRLTVSRT